LTKAQAFEYIGFLERNGYNSYNIRVLDFDYKNFRTNDPVTMRLSLEKNHEKIWE
jgi:hypothetical protein